MTPPSGRPRVESDSERELLDLLAEEYLQALQRGEQPSVDAFVQRCPQRSDEIRALLTAIDHIQPVSDRLQFTETKLPQSIGGK